jgi:hypothetical protein
MPHFLYVPKGKLDNCEHMTQDKPDKNLLHSFWNMLTGRNYKHNRDGD